MSTIAIPGRSSRPRLLRNRGVAAVVAVTACIGVGVAAIATAGPASAAGRGYVSDAYLRHDPTTQSAQLARITNQYVDINCYLSGENVNGTAKWFKATYYNQTGYLSASVVSQQPTVGHC